MEKQIIKEPGTLPGLFAFNVGPAEKVSRPYMIHKLSITMLNYRQNTSVLIKFDLKIVHYSLLQICLRVLAFFDI
jgi:hypothetical protein